MNNSVGIVFLWAFAGFLLGAINVWIQGMSINQVGKKDDRKLIREFSIFSIIRIVLALIILLIAFRNGFAAGISSLTSFIITRWLGVIVLARYARERS